MVELLSAVKKKKYKLLSDKEAKREKKRERRFLLT